MQLGLSASSESLTPLTPSQVELELNGCDWMRDCTPCTLQKNCFGKTHDNGKKMISPQIL